MEGTAYRCPTQRHPQDTRAERYDNTPKGCGCLFTDEPDNGWVGCPNCGLHFQPEQEIGAVLVWDDEQA